MGLLGDIFNWVTDKVKTPFERLDAWTGKSSVDAQKEANAYNIQAAQDTNATNLQIARENNELLQRYYDNQIAQNSYFYEDTKKYNSAAEQVNRLKDASLNPALAMYQGVNAGTISASSAPSPPPIQQAVMQAPHMQPVDYAPMANAITRTVSLLAGLGGVADSLASIPTAASRAASVAKGAAADAGIKSEDYEVAKASREFRIKELQSKVDIMDVNKAILNETLKQAAFDTTMKDLINKTLVGNQGKFSESLLAEWESKLKSNKLTDANILDTFRAAYLKQMEGYKAGAIKGWYSVLDSFMQENKPSLIELGRLLGKTTNTMLGKLNSLLSGKWSLF